ncbi:MAG: sigma-70 family RNA polymerase sigma factor [Pseudomonadales bacterium]
MSSDSENVEPTLENYREYLQLLAQLNLDKQLQGKIDLSGVVQQTMLEAYQALPRYQKQGTDQLAAWLRQILANNLADEVRKLRTGKRDVRREKSLDAALQHSSVRLQEWLANEQSSPSGRIQRQEQAVSLTAALAKLPDAQRDALVLRHFQGHSLAEIAAQLGRSHAAVAGLLKRGLQQLRNQLDDWK